VRFGVGAPPDLWGADQMVEWATANELRPFIVIGGWNPAPSPDEYAEWVGEYVHHYSGTRIAFCLWNEPNYRDDAHPNPLGVDQALELNLAGARAARRADPEAKVLGSPIAPTGEWEHYFEDLYRELAPGLVEVAMHIYPGGRYEDRMDRVRDALMLGERFGPVHVTELDMAAPWLSDDTTKPELAAKAMRLCERRRVRSLIYYDIDAHRAEAGALKKERNA
jgi:GH35 family endo-1,4-beta-xylanase